MAPRRKRSNGKKNKNAGLACVVDVSGKKPRVVCGRLIDPDEAERIAFGDDDVADDEIVEHEDDIGADEESSEDVREDEDDWEDS